MSDRIFVTTAIPYVNAAPHVGFAYELVLADAFARHHRAQGADVRFQTGADENSLKNVQAAQAAGRPVAEFVAENAARFEALREPLALCTDDFVRTSADPRHAPAVERLWRAVEASGDLYRGHYCGAYCLGCEQFLASDELEDGKCPEHRRAPESVQEHNWFFRLSRYQEHLIDLIESGALGVEPASHRRALIDFARRGLTDISVSRASLRARGWGLAVPEDPEQVIYVWFDALANYLSGLGYGTSGSEWGAYWGEGVRRVHVLGKGVARFHGIYWPAFLHSAGLPAPTQLFVHGYVTVDGKKIGKSLGNVIDPLQLVERFGTDTLRYFLLRHVHTDRDGDLTEARLRAVHEGELAASLGNLVRRVSRLIERYPDGCARPPNDAPAREIVSDLFGKVHCAVERFALHEALDHIFERVSALNRLLSEQAPWVLARRAAHGERAQAAASLSGAREALRILAEVLRPFLPNTAARILEDLGYGLPPVGRPQWGARRPQRAVRTGPVLFAQLPKQ